MRILIALGLCLLFQEPKEFKFDDTFALGAKVLKEEGKTKEWRAALGKEMDRFVKLVGKAATPKIAEHLPKLREECLKESLSLVTKNQDEINESAAVIAKAEGKEIEKRSVLVCDEGKFESIKEVVVVCTGDLRVKKLERAVVFAKGTVHIERRAVGSLIYAGGKIISLDEIEDCTLLAEGGVEIKNDSEDNVFINTPNRIIGNVKKGGDRDETIDGLPGKKKS